MFGPSLVECEENVCLCVTSVVSSAAVSVCIGLLLGAGGQLHDRLMGLSRLLLLYLVVQQLLVAAAPGEGGGPGQGCAHRLVVPLAPCAAPARRETEERLSCS